MFILYAIVIGLAMGFLLRGRVAGLASLQIRGARVIGLGLFIQLVLFTDAVAATVGDLGPVLYVGSTLLVVAVLILNRAIPGMVVLIAGAGSNLTAILANGGYMPAGQEALEALGRAGPTIYSNTSVVPHPALWPLTDVFALPAWLPFANVFSIGDLLIGVGVVLIIVLAMRRPAASPAASLDLARQP